MFDIRVMGDDREKYILRRYPMADFWLGFKLPTVFPDDGKGSLSEYYDQLPGRGMFNVFGCLGFVLENN